MSLCSPFFAAGLPAGAAGAAAVAGAAAGAACVVGGFLPPPFFRGCASTPPAMRERAEARTQARATHVRIIFLAFHEPRRCLAIFFRSLAARSFHRSSHKTRDDLTEQTEVLPQILDRRSPRGRPDLLQV